MTRMITGTLQECLRALEQKGLAVGDSHQIEEWTRTLLDGKEAVSHWSPAYGSHAGRTWTVRARILPSDQS